MNDREIVLAALAAGGRGVGFSPIQVQKILFLIDREAVKYVGGPHFNFVAYDYGPFDRAVYDVLDDLAKEGLVEVRNLGRLREYVLTNKGYEYGLAELNGLSDRGAAYVRRLVDWVRSLTFRQLVAAIYRRYPKMQANSLFRP